MQPDEYKKLKAFKDLITDTREALLQCSTPAVLSRTTEDFAVRWEPVDAAFAKLLRGIQGQAWSMQLPQIRDVGKMIAAHLDKQLASVNSRLDG